MLQNMTKEILIFEAATSACGEMHIGEVAEDWLCI